jgi:hypothetical protein
MSTRFSTIPSPNAYVQMGVPPSTRNSFSARSSSESSTAFNITIRPIGFGSAATSTPWYLRVTTPVTVPEL